MVNPDSATPCLETSCIHASARGGSRPGFAADYFPKHAHAPFALRHPVKMRAPDQGMPSQTRPVRLPPTSHCENYREPACKRCLRLCRGVRACCWHGHHRCRKHSLPPCALCAGSSFLPRICCKCGHHPATSKGKVTSTHCLVSGTDGKRKSRSWETLYGSRKQAKSSDGCVRAGRGRSAMENTYAYHKGEPLE